MNLVVGSTGMLGMEICRQLRSAGKPVRALVRPTSAADKVATLRASGAAIVEGDLRDPASLREACNAATCVISTATAISAFTPENNFDNVDGGTRDLIDAAKAAGADQFVLISVSSGINPDCALIRNKRRNEQHLMKSGLAYTILRPSAFMEIWLSPLLGFDIANARAQVIGNGDARNSYISYIDVAKFCVAVIGNPKLYNTAIELGGPDAISPLEAVSIFEKVTGNRFAVTHIPLEALQAQYAAATNDLEKTFAALMLEQGKGDHVPMQETLRAFPGITLRSVEAYARDIVPLPAA